MVRKPRYESTDQSSVSAWAVSATPKKLYLLYFVLVDKLAKLWWLRCHNCSVSRANELLVAIGSRVNVTEMSYDTTPNVACACLLICLYVDPCWIPFQLDCQEVFIVSVSYLQQVNSSLAVKSYCIRQHIVVSVNAPRGPSGRDVNTNSLTERAHSKHNIMTCVTVPCWAWRQHDCVKTATCLTYIHIPCTVSASRVLAPLWWWKTGLVFR